MVWKGVSACIKNLVDALCPGRADKRAVTCGHALRGSETSRLPTLPGKNGFRLETGILPALPLPRDLHTLILWILLVENYITLPVQLCLCIEDSTAAVLKQGCRGFSCTHEGSSLFRHLLVQRTCDAYPSWHTRADCKPTRRLKYPLF